MRDGLAWMNRRRAKVVTPDFRVSLAFNGANASDGDLLTSEAVAEGGEWYFINHTWSHAGLDDISYSDALEEFTLNIQLADDLPLVPFDPRNLVTGNVSGLVNPDAMQAAWDAGIRFAVSDTSAEGCDNPSPNTTFYDQIEPGILLVPRRPPGVPYDATTPADWVGRYNAEGGNATYGQILQQTSESLLLYQMRGDADPWMFHQANLRAYDGVHSVLSDLIDRIANRLHRLLRVPVRTLSMNETALRFARRINYETAGVRATLYRGRALVIDTSRSVSVPVTGVRDADGEAYGGDVIGLVAVTPGTTTCVPLDAAGVGCSPPPIRQGGPGPATALPVGYCDASSLPHEPPMQTAIARGSDWRYRDQGLAQSRVRRLRLGERLGPARLRRGLPGHCRLVRPRRRQQVHHHLLPVHLHTLRSGRGDRAHRRAHVRRRPGRLPERDRDRPRLHAVRRDQLDHPRRQPRGRQRLRDLRLDRRPQPPGRRQQHHRRRGPPGLAELERPRLRPRALPRLSALRRRMARQSSYRVFLVDRSRSRLNSSRAWASASSRVGRAAGAPSSGGASGSSPCSAACASSSAT
jgi:hypothetical protein